MGLLDLFKGAGSSRTKCGVCGCPGRVANVPDWPPDYHESIGWATPTTLMLCDDLGRGLCHTTVCLKCAYEAGKRSVGTFQCPSCGSIIPVPRDSQVIGELFHWR